MSAEGDIPAALMARLGELAGYTVLHPRKGGDQPAGEHIRVALVPNDSLRTGLDVQEQEHRGFLVLTLVSDLGQYEAASRNAAGAIAGHFPLNAVYESGDASVKIMGQTVRQAREEMGRWETPIWIEYQAFG